jgi:siroheme synthase-like protein
MTHPSYPICLNLRGRRVLVAGAGRVATRKIERLVEAGASVEVVALEATPRVQRLAEQGQLALALRAVRDEDTRGALLVLCATDDGPTNQRLAAAARAVGALASRVDAPEASDFTVPALARGEHLEATVSTGGAAPSASRRLGKELKAWVERGPDRFAREIARARVALRGHPEASARLRKLSNGGLFEACAAHDEAQVEALVTAALDAKARDIQVAPALSQGATGEVEARASTREQNTESGR